MALETRDIAEYLVSGEADNIVVAGNIGYAAVQDPMYNGMFQRIENGITTLYKVVDQDVHWEDEDTTSVPVTTTSTELLSVTIDQDMLEDDGSFSISGSVDNNSNKALVLDIDIFDDGFNVGYGSVTLLKNETGKLFAFSGGLSGTMLAGSVVTVNFSTSESGALVLRGDVIATKIKLTKAQAAPVLRNGKIDIESDNPAIRLFVEDGGIAGTFQIYDMETPNHMVSSIQWVKASQETDWTLSDKDTGITKAMFQMKPDGTFHIGNGMIQHQIATDADLDVVMNTLVGKIINKADKTSLPTIYSGESEPLNTLGKDLDWYHRFEAGTTIVTELYNDTSMQNYHPQDFFLMNVYDGDVIQITPGNRLLFIDNVANETLSSEDLALIIGSNNISLEIVSNTAGSLVAVYNQSWDAVIENITTSTAFRVEAKEGTTTSKEYDYQKHNGEWFRTDFLNTEQISELIRSYHTIVTMSLADDKKPTRAEAITAFKTLPNYDWAKDDTFYIRDSTGAKTMFCTYFADGATDEASAGMFFFKDMNECI